MSVSISALSEAAGSCMVIARDPAHREPCRHEMARPRRYGAGSLQHTTDNTHGEAKSKIWAPGRAGKGARAGAAHCL